MRHACLVDWTYPFGVGGGVGGVALLRSTLGGWEELLWDGGHGRRHFHLILVPFIPLGKEWHIPATQTARGFQRLEGTAVRIAGLRRGRGWPSVTHSTTTTATVGMMSVALQQEKKRIRLVVIYFFDWLIDYSSRISLNVSLSLSATTTSSSWFPVRLLEVRNGTRAVLRCRLTSCTCEEKETTDFERGLAPQSPTPLVTIMSLEEAVDVLLLCEDVPQVAQRPTSPMLVLPSSSPSSLGSPKVRFFERNGDNKSRFITAASSDNLLSPNWRVLIQTRLIIRTATI